MVCICDSTRSGIEVIDIEVIDIAVLGLEVIKFEVEDR